MNIGNSFKEFFGQGNEIVEVYLEGNTASRKVFGFCLLELILFSDRK